jgi:AraC-like DNA-binding protein
MKKSELLAKAFKYDYPITNEKAINASVSSTAPRNMVGLYQAHAFWEMGIVLRGTYNHESPAEKLSLKRGGCWWVGPWEPHRYTFPSETKIIVIGFLPAVFSSLPESVTPQISYLLPFLKPAVRPLLRQQSPAVKAKFIWLAEALAQELIKKPAGWQMNQRLYFGLLLVELMRGHQLPVPPVQKDLQAVDMIMSAVNFINRNLHRKISIGDAARVACLGRTQFMSHFKGIMGLPFGQYILKRRLERVRYELRAHTYKVEALARRWGFYDASHLIRQYKKFFGSTPRF